MTAVLSQLSSVSCSKTCKSAKHDRKTEKRASVEPHMEQYTWEKQFVIHTQRANKWLTIKYLLKTYYCLCVCANVCVWLFGNSESYLRGRMHKLNIFVYKHNSDSKANLLKMHLLYTYASVCSMCSSISFPIEYSILFYTTFHIK